jgi:hypothetical protein
MAISDFLRLSSNEDFYVDRDDFSKLEIKPTGNDSFYYFSKGTGFIKHFILLEKETVIYCCSVTLIKKDDKFSPRIAFSIRKKDTKGLFSKATPITAETHNLKSNVDLNDCHSSFWKLVSFIQSLKDIEIPKEGFSLVSQGDAEIVSALGARDKESIKLIIKQLSSTPGVTLSESDINGLLKRKDKLTEFERALVDHKSDETWWQNFFENNKWIFGYGLDYQIIKQEEAQPHYGGMKVDGIGDQKGDYLTSTQGDINFVVLVEIKTPDTKLLQGSKEIRRGAWSLSKDLPDALVQIEANIHTWDKQGSAQPDNLDRFEGQGIYTVQPKGIIIIGSLSELNDRNKRETFQRFRKSIHGVDIITFDELYHRAKFIIEHSE